MHNFVALFAFSVENALTINVGKCFVMLIGEEVPTAIYTNNGTIILAAHKITDIGVLDKNNLSASTQCMKVAEDGLR